MANDNVGACLLPGNAAVLSSGNVVFSAPRAADASLQKRAETSMEKRLGQAFVTVVRPVDVLREMLAGDPYETFGKAVTTRTWEAVAKVAR